MTPQLRIAAAAFSLVAFAFLPAWMAAQAPTTWPASRPTATTTTSTSQPVDKAAVDALIRQLGDDSYKVREKATAHLIEMGYGVRAILEAKLQEKDLELEVVQRLKTALAKIPSYPPVDKSAVGELIRRLGDDSLKAREKATAQLVDMGPGVRPLLNEKLKEKDLDPEVVQRIKQILAKVPYAGDEEGKILTDGATGVTVTLSDDGLSLTGSQGDKTLWTTRFSRARPATSIRLDDGRIIVSPQGWTYDPATGRRTVVHKAVPIIVE